MDRSPRCPRSSRGIGMAVAMAIATGLLPPAAGPRLARAQPTGGPGAAVTPVNRSLEELQRTWVTWQRRPGPERRVVDMVCLVPDLPTFLEAIATWDEGHAFPILIDDVE